MSAVKDFVDRLNARDGFADNCFETKCRVAAGHIGSASKALQTIIYQYERNLGPHEVCNIHDFFDDEKSREYLAKRLAKFLNVLKRVNLEKPRVEAVVTPSQVLDISREGK